jgi:hypothetical protein
MRVLNISRKGIPLQDERMKRAFEEVRNQKELEE